MISCLKICQKNVLLSSRAYFFYRKPLTTIFKNVTTKCNAQPNILVHLNSWKGIVLKVTAGIGIGSGLSLYQNYASCQIPTYSTRVPARNKDEPVPQFDWNMFLTIIKPFYFELMVSILAALISAYFNIQIPRLLGEIINAVISTSCNDGAKYYSEVTRPTCRMLFVYAMLSASTFFYIFFLARVGEGVAEALKTRAFQNILRQDIAFFDQHRSGELLNRLTNDINDFRAGFRLVISQGMKNTAQVIGCAITLVHISPQMTGLMMVAVPSIVFAGSIFGAFLRMLSYNAKMQNSYLTLLAEEAFSNIRTVRSFGMEQGELHTFTVQARKTRVINEHLGIGVAAFQGATSFFLNSIVLSTVFLGGRLLAQDRINHGDLTAFLVALQMMQRSFSQLSLLFGAYVRGLHAGARVCEVINYKATMPMTDGITVPYHSFVPEIEFKNVYFNYPNRKDKPVLKNFSLKIPAGKIIAVVGVSGSGKSTLAYLLERFYDVNAGKITISDIDIRNFNPTWLRARICGTINQEPVLFATTVLENIRYGQPDATEEQVIEAAKLANADEFIRKFPNGYNTLVGERGLALSGGQKQRIAIARALLKNPPILILDEATSALDSQSERIVQKALEDVMKGRTTIVIAHRLSTIKNADIIVVMNNGVIVEIGNHSSLLSLNGIYASFVNLQTTDC